MVVHNYTKIEEICWASVKVASLELISVLEICFGLGEKWLVWGLNFYLFVFTVGILVIIREMIFSLIRELLR